MADLFSRLADNLAEQDRLKDPVVWAKEKAGIDLWSKQQEIVRSVETHKQTAVRSAHGTGKSLLASILACWWIDTHPLGEAYVISTAPSRQQVHSVLWEAMRTIHSKADLPGEIQISDRWVIDGKEVGIGRRPADHQPHSFQGIHRKYVLMLIDEACGVPKWLWDAGISITTSEHCRILAIGNPDDPNSEFKFKFDPRSAWHNIKISIWDSPNFSGEDVSKEAQENLSDKSYVEVAEQDWGIGTAIWQSKIEGNFPEEDENAVIPVSWVQDAYARYEMFEEIDDITKPAALKQAKILSVDVAYTGRDKTVIAHYQPPRFTKFEEFNPKNQKELYKLITERANRQIDKIVIDVGGGYGSGVFEMLRDAGYNVVAFSGGNKTTKLDKTRKFSFTRIRSAAFWKVREQLSPSNEPILAFPPAHSDAFKNKEAGEKLLSDLTTPKYEIQLDRIQVETKDSIRKRLRRSTDYGDTVMMALWVPPISEILFEDDSAYSFTDSNIDNDAAFSYGLGGELDGSISYDD